MSITGNIRKWLFITFWSIAGAGAMVLLIAAIKSRNNKTCTGYRIAVSGSLGKSFIDKKDILMALTRNGEDKLTGKTLASYDLRQMENELGKNPWIKKPALYFDNNGVLWIHLLSREPEARIFTVGGNSFYIDSSGAQMPLSAKSLVNIPVFTDYPYEKIRTHGADSILLAQIKAVSHYIGKDSFWMAEIEQVEITPQRTFEMTPEIGNHLIVFGDGGDCENKFRRLFLFYKNVLAKTGFEKYSRVDISYAGQVIGTKKGSGITKADSILALKNIQQLIRSARQLQADTIRQERIKPLENSTETEQSLTNYDLIPNNGDSAQNESEPKSGIRADKAPGKQTGTKQQDAAVKTRAGGQKPVSPASNKKPPVPKALMPDRRQ